MPAQLDQFSPQLQDALNHGVLSVAQAWSLQSLLDSTPSETFVPVPTEWHPWMERLELWEMPVLNDLPL